MSKMVINQTTLKEIGNAIRKKTGKKDLIPVNTLATEIDSLSSGGAAVLGREGKAVNKIGALPKGAIVKCKQKYTNNTTVTEQQSELFIEGIDKKNSSDNVQWVRINRGRFALVPAFAGIEKKIHILDVVEHKLILACSISTSQFTEYRDILTLSLGDNYLFVAGMFEERVESYVYHLLDHSYQQVMKFSVNMNQITNGYIEGGWLYPNNIIAVLSGYGDTTHEMTLLEWDKQTFNLNQIHSSRIDSDKWIPWSAASYLYNRPSYRDVMGLDWGGKTSVSLYPDVPMLRAPFIAQNAKQLDEKKFVYYSSSSLNYFYCHRDQQFCGDLVMYQAGRRINWQSFDVPNNETDMFITSFWVDANTQRQQVGFINLKLADYREQEMIKAIPVADQPLSSCRIFMIDHNSFYLTYWNGQQLAYRYYSCTTENELTEDGQVTAITQADSHIGEEVSICLLD